MGHVVDLGAYCNEMKTLLVCQKYDRSQWGKVVGYGMKWL
jgi:hypothetical protein